jgi:hypothetical protein
VSDTPTLLDAEEQRRGAKRKLWAQGLLSWKFKSRPWCKDIYSFIRSNWGVSPFVFVMAHRRSGKSSTGIVVGLEECLRTPNTSVAIVCRSNEQAQGIIDESLLPLLEDCPRQLQPRRIKNDFKYVFDHNGSKIVILPANALGGRKGRGRKFKYILVTEACFIDNLQKLVSSVLGPTIRDVLGEWQGMMVLESTPPEEEDHDSVAMFAAAEVDDRAFFLPLSKNTHASPRFVQACQDDCGGPDTVEYRREYECQFVVDSSTTVVPEFTTERAFGKTDLPGGPLPLVREVPRPPGSDLYASLDPGGRDLSGLLWGYYHFAQNLVVIEDELTLLNMTSDDMAAQVKLKERQLWGAEPDGKLMRVADNSNVILLYDLQRLHKLKFWASAKDNKDAQINQLRIMVRDGLLVIHPRCRLLIKTLRLAKRAKQVSKGFERGEEIGHADLLDALLYLVRNVRRNAPAPAPVVRAAEQHVRDSEPRRSSGALALGRALGRFRR